MKKALLLLLPFLSFLVSHAQMPADEIQLVQQLWGKEKKAIIGDYLQLTEKEGSAFWPLYDQYQVAQSKISGERLNLMGNYTRQYSTLTDKQAQNLAKGFLSNNKAMGKLQQRYFKKMSKQVGPLQAARFMQAESYIDTKIKSALSEYIPFIREGKALTSSVH
ncbi:hypothetical protein SAMN05444008_10499 [Cnuella takakiae]|uniref:LTXXQ motif family protein n=1 Tax=Cnuella takakiae TaxID=1302690 RepID=A0A1M4XZJ9_9BACT|nr:hypothetical protein [Cnuella takakiae]OLY92999.1 hypothetical protein BUE76_14670 [Cnuella takakiae]SHE98921.1 hypothetical protein SAMN05444008_10499 [Cnuella takakiae]